jgi:adenylosuccinate synthase
MRLVRKPSGNEKIGTTGKGIGPAYEERASRKAVLFGDLFQPDTLKEKIEASIKEKNFPSRKVLQPRARLMSTLLIKELRPLTDELVTL